MPATFLQAKLSPLHDSAGSQQSLEASDGEASGSDASSSLNDISSGRQDLPDTEEKTAVGGSHETGQDTAHFIGLPQKKSGVRGRLEPESYQLSCSGQCDSLLPDSGEVGPD